MWKVILKILISGIILKTFIHANGPGQEISVLITSAVKTHASLGICKVFYLIGLFVIPVVCLFI